MTCRVHYINPERRRAYKDVTAAKEDARGVFGHLFPGVGRIERVEVVGGDTSPRGHRQAAPPLNEATGDAVGKTVAAGLRAWLQKAGKR